MTLTQRKTAASFVIGGAGIAIFLVLVMSNPAIAQWTGYSNDNNSDNQQLVAMVPPSESQNTGWGSWDQLGNLCKIEKCLLYTIVSH